MYYTCTVHVHCRCNYQLLVHVYINFFNLNSVYYDTCRSTSKNMVGHIYTIIMAEYTYNTNKRQLNGN